MPTPRSRTRTEWRSPDPPDAGKPPAPEVVAQAGRRIRETRLSKGISSKELAFEAGINPSFLNYIETGRKAPSMATLVKLAQALGVEVPRLFRAAGRKPGSGERCLGSFLRILSWSSRKERALCHEILSAYAKLARYKSAEVRERILKSAVALLHCLR